MPTLKDVADSFQAGKTAGIAEEHLRGLKEELNELRVGQQAIMAKLEELNKWRWIVVGIASAIAFLISVFMEMAKKFW